MYDGYEPVKDFKDINPNYKDLDSSEEYELKLMDEGRIPLYPADNELFIDINTPDQEVKFNQMVSCLKRNDFSFKTMEVFKKESKTKGHFHFIVKLPFIISHLERICLQACLGSDNFRETLSYLRNRRGDRNPVIFAEDITQKKKIPEEDKNITLTTYDMNGLPVQSIKFPNVTEFPNLNATELGSNYDQA